MPDWLIITCAFVVTAAAGTVGWVQLYFARRDKRLSEDRERLAAEREREERAKREAAEAELREMRRRAPNTAPFFAACDRRYGLLVIPWEGGQRANLQAGGEQMLDFARDEVGQIPTGAWVFLVIENQGAWAVDLVLDLDGVEAHFAEAQNDPCLGMLVILYRFDPALRGQRQTLTATFMTPDGVRLAHRYEIIHGTRWLRRVDPA